MWRHSVTALALAGLLPAARAQDPVLLMPAQISACTAETDDAKRLACYDQLHRRVPTPAPLPADAALPPAVRGLAEARRSDAQAEADPARESGEATRRAVLGSTLDERWELEPRYRLANFLPRPYKPVYLLPITWSPKVNDKPSSPSPGHQVDEAQGLNHAEAKFQISFKSRLWGMADNGPLSVWGAYTQSSRWQVYNAAISRPFRETNYEPELIGALRTDIELLGWRARLASLSLNHQSNGRALPLSRSWNRVVAELNLERGETVVTLRPWWRLKESLDSDDNPGIEDYVGRGELRVVHKLGRNVLSLQARHSLRGGERSRGSLLLEWAFPIGGGLHGYAQVFSGYGESLIDYNFRQTRVGLGVSVVEWR